MTHGDTQGLTLQLLPLLSPLPLNEAAHRVLGTGGLCGMSSAGQPAAPSLGPPPWGWLTLPRHHSVIQFPSPSTSLRGVGIRPGAPWEQTGLVG